MAPSHGVFVATEGNGGCDGCKTSTRNEVLAATFQAKRSCMVFSVESPLRKSSILISSSGVFDKFIFIVIVCNCVSLASSSNRQGFDSTRFGKALAILDYVYLSIFTLEMIAKVIAMGFVLGRGTYLRSGWNVLDFLVVVMGYVNLLSPTNLTAIRAFRAMRPLRAINRVKGMKVLVNTMIGSLPLLLDVFLLCAFTFFMFSLIAVQLFAGFLWYRCGAPDFSGAYGLPDSAGGEGGKGVLVQLANVSYAVPDDQTEDMCSGPLSSEVVWYLVNDTERIAVPGRSYTGRVCDHGMYCTLYGNPSYGILSYDTILWSWLTVFQHITLSGWSDVMYMVMDAVNYWVWIFYVALIIFGAFFMVNLALAVLAVKFSADCQDEDAQRSRREVNGDGKTAATAPRQAVGGGTEAAAPAEAPGRVRAAADEGGGGGDRISSPSSLVAALKRSRADDDTDTVAPGSAPPPGLCVVRRLAWRVAVARSLEVTTAGLILVNTAVMCVNWYGMPANVEQVTNVINYGLTVYFAVEVGVRVTAFGARFFRSGMNLFDLAVVVVSVVEMVADLVPNVAGLGPLSVLRAFRLLRVFRLARSWRQLNAILSGMFRSVQASLSLVALTVLFVFVAALVGMAVFGYKFMFCDYVEGASAVCPLGQRVWGQCPDHFHCYLPCVEEQYGSWVDAPGSFYNGLAYCDRFCASADAAAAADMNASSPVVASAGGCEYLAMVGKSQVPRAQFDNILWGMYTVFQVLTGENWNDIMLDAMRTVSPWACLYFVGVILVGNYLVFNLFIAILLDNLDLRVQECSVAAAASRAGSGGGASTMGAQRPSRSPSFPLLVRPPFDDGSDGVDLDPVRGGGIHHGGGCASGGAGGAGGNAVDGICSLADVSGSTRGRGLASVASSRALRRSALGTARLGLEPGPQIAPGTRMEGGVAVGHLAQLPAPSRLQPSLSVRDQTGSEGATGCPLPPAATLETPTGERSFSATCTEWPSLFLPVPPSCPTSRGAAGSANGVDSGGSGADDGKGARGCSPCSPAELSPAVMPELKAAVPVAESAELDEAWAAAIHETAAAPGPVESGQSQSAMALLVAVAVAEEPSSRPAGPMAESVESPVDVTGSERHAAGLTVVPQGQDNVEVACALALPYPLPPSPCPSSGPPCLLLCGPPPPRPAFALADHQAAPFPGEAASTAAVAAAATCGFIANSSGTGSGSSPCSSDSAVLPKRPVNTLMAVDLRGQPSLPDDPLPVASAMLSPSRHEQQQTQGQQHQQLQQVQHDHPHHHHHHDISRVPQLGPSPPSQRLPSEGFRVPRHAPPTPSTPSAHTDPAAADSACMARPGLPWADVLAGQSLLVFGPDSCVRRCVAAVVHNWWFESAILLLILVSCVCLVLDAPDLDPGSRLAAALWVMDYVFTAVFTLEAALKIITFGFALTGPHAYIRSGWNVLDLAIVALGWALLVVQQVGISGAGDVKVLRVLRALRALRPLRAVHGFPGLKVVVNTLFAVLPAMVHVALVCIFFYLIFAILAVNLFKGKLYNCVDAASGERIDPFYVLPAGQVLTRAWCEAGSQTITQSAYYSGTNVSMPAYQMDTQWVNPTANFDHVGVAMLTLFQVATLSLWVDITFSAVDATSVDQQPSWNHNPWVVLLFVVFVVICTFFVLNLFVGVTLDKFAEMHQAQHAPSAFLTPQQQFWVDTQRRLLRAEASVRPPPRRPRGWLHGALYTAAASRAFEVVMMCVITANVVFMATVHWDMSPAWQAVMSYSNVIFTGIFVAEAALKLVVLSPGDYFHDGWNCFDFFVVAVSVVSVALDFSDTRDISFMPVLRVLRIVRVVRLVRHARGMQKLLRTLVTSLPALANVGGVMVIFFFMFAVIGVNLFAGIKRGEALNSHANFDSFPNAMLLLFRMLTGEGWDAVMQDCMIKDNCLLVLQDVNVTPPASTTAAAYPSSPIGAAPFAPVVAAVVTLAGGTYLDPDDPLLAALPSNATDNQCPLSPAAAVIYFPVFVVLCNFILLQLVIAVLLENLVEADDGGEEAEEAARPVPKASIESFAKAWAAAAQADADTWCGRGGWRRRGGLLLHVSVLPEVLAATDPPLGAHGSAHLRREVLQRLLRVRAPLYAGHEVSFIEVLHALTDSLCGTALPPSERDKLERRLRKRLPRAEPHIKYTAAHYHAGNAVAATVRGFLLRHELKEKEAALAAEEERRQQQQQQEHLLRHQISRRQQHPQPADAQTSSAQPQPLQPTSSPMSWLLSLLVFSRPAPVQTAAPAPVPPQPSRFILSSPLRYFFRLPLAYVAGSIAAVFRAFLYGRPAPYGTQPAVPDTAVLQLQQQP